MQLRDKKYRSESGILLALSSLPSEYGIGTMGIEAYNFIDFLKNARQTYWQMLPLVPLGEGNSPYKSVSCFAGEILYIDLDFLIRDGLLSPEDIPTSDFPKNTDYDAVRKFKIPILKTAAERFNTKRADYIRFLQKNSYWINDYAVFSAAIEDTSSESIISLEENIKYRMPYAMSEFCETHRREISFFKIMQFIFYNQFHGIKKYATKCGIKLIGDIPFYVSPDSADVWKNPEYYKIGRDFTPILVAGVPPDIFSSDGQLWGNPIYDFDAQRRDGFLWWKKRLMHCKNMYDVIRIDHFRAFSSYYTISYGAKNARSGTWEKGVGLPFWLSVRKSLGKINIIAEDLGGDEPDVRKLIAETGFPDMKILQFAFDGDESNKFLPRNYGRNSVCYTGTHDNDTSLGWFNSADKKEQIEADRLLPDIKNKPFSIRMILGAMRCKSRIVIIPMQDLLCLDSDARMNIPGTARGNWEWRMSKTDMSEENSRLLRELSKGRN